MFDLLLASLQAQALGAKKSPFIVAISGFGGSGKSTLAAKLAEALGSAEVISIDAFVVNHLRGRSAEWADFDRERFREEVLVPAQQGQPITYGIYNWQADAVDQQRVVPKAKFLIVEGCSLFHPALVPFYDFSVWVDVELEEAARRGIARDRAQGADWDDRWLEVWMPNERDFFEKYQPKTMAGFVYSSSAHPC